MSKVEVLFKLFENNKRYKPKKAYSRAAGSDLVARMNKEIVLYPGDKKIIPLGIFLEIPDGYEVQLRARSGFAAKTGLTLINGIGTVDSDYTGELKAAVINLGEGKVTLRPFDRICQMVVKELPCVELIQVKEIKPTLRGDKGFGSSGRK